MGLLNADEETTDVGTALVFFVNGKKVSTYLSTILIVLHTNSSTVKTAFKLLLNLVGPHWAA